jgi:protease I
MALNGKKIVLLVENSYQEMEFWYPFYRLKEEGADVIVAGTGRGSYTSKYGYPAREDVQASDVNVSEIAAVVVPGGYAPDLMRVNDGVLKLVRDAYDSGKLVAAICHAGWVLISAGILRGKRATSVRAIRDDMVNAGVHFVDQEVVQDGNIITSRVPGDLPAFLRAIISYLH